MQLCSLQSASLEADEKKNELISIKLPGDKKTVQDSSSPIVVAEPKPSYTKEQDHDKQKNSPEKTVEKKELVTSEPVTSSTQTAQKTVKKNIPVGGLSINGLLNKNKQGTQKDAGEEKELKPRTDLPKKDFTAQQLLDTWMKYAKQAKEKSKVNLYATLTSRQPVLKQNFLVEFTIDNLAQRDAIANEKAELMLFLRSELQNYEIQLETIVTKDDSEKKPYTASDKFKRMAEKNPVLNNLKQKFDLDLGI